MRLNDKRLPIRKSLFPIFYIISKILQLCLTGYAQDDTSVILSSLVCRTEGPFFRLNYDSYRKKR